MSKSARHSTHDKILFNCFFLSFFRFFFPFHQKAINENTPSANFRQFSGHVCIVNTPHFNGGEKRIKISHVLNYFPIKFSFVLHWLTKQGDILVHPHPANGPKTELQPHLTSVGGRPHTHKNTPPQQDTPGMNMYFFFPSKSRKMDKNTFSCASVSIFYSLGSFSK